MKKTHKGLAKRLVAASLAFSLLFAASLTSCSDDDDEEEGEQTQITSLSAPTNLAAEQAVDDEGDATRAVSLSWSAVDGASYYWVYYNTTGDASGATLLTSYVTATSYTAYIIYDGNYYFWMKAASGTDSDATTSDLSECATCYVAYFAFLDAPEGVTASVSEDTSNAVDITWAHGGTSYYYSIYYSTSDDSSTATLLEKNVYGYASSYSTTVTETIVLTESGTYYFWVKRQSGYQYSSSSGVHTSDFSEVTDAVEFTYSSLEAPEDVTVSKPYTNALQVSWSDNSAAYYWVYYGTENDSSKATQLTKTSLAYTYLSLGSEDGGTYYFWVKAADGYSSDYASSDYSTVASYKFTYTTLTTPANVSVAKAYSSTYKVSWDDTGAYYYRVWQGTSSDSSAASLVTKYISGYCYHYVTLSTSGTYYFWVQSADGASDDDAVSDFSTAASITVE